MNSRDEIYRLVWTLLGAIVGLGFGLSAMLMLFNHMPTLNTSTGIVPMAIVLAFCGGGLVGGGYLALFVVTKKQRVMRKKYFQEKKKRKKGKR